MVYLSKKQRMYYFNSIICILIMICTRFIPPVGGITPYGMEVLGIFFGAVYGWVAVGFVWPSFFAMILLGLSDYGNIEAVFAEGFSNNVPLQIMISFIFFEIIAKSGFIDFFANWIIRLKINQGRPWMLSFTFFLASGLISSITNQFMVIIIFWYIIFSICKQVGYTVKDKWTAYILVGITCFAEISLTLFPFCPFSIIAIGLAQQSIKTIDVNALGWVILGLSVLVLICLLYTLIGKYVLKIDASKIDISKISEITVENKKLGSGALIGAIYLSVFVLIIVLPTFLPDNWSLTVMLNKFGVLGACAVCFVGLFFKVDKEGKSKLNFNQFAQNGIAWEMLILVVATMPLCAAMESDETGIVKAFVNFALPLFQQMGPLLFVIISIGLLSIISQFAHNLILMFVFLPILSGLCVELGVSPVLYIFLLMLGLDTAMATPGGSAASAMMFGNTEWIERKKCYEYACLWVALSLVIILCVGYPLGVILL
ncbi:MAG: SLC13 family permease [Peptococcaceae bacterium]|nr:SLC13 family permease [Peptococcaceae bacterium]